MRREILLAAVFIFGVMVVPSMAHADGCYMCQGGGYVKFQGSDTFDKRKKAKEQFACTVSGTSSSCSHARGTVAWYELLMQQCRRS